eukprot:GEMP01032384.1.p1 GENE.GEMP01032384.1~~GEMP01032384.1.p1  ORF type:complete len:404 (-),score=56.99 GEMP01032384.1:841-2052(-)
MWIVSPLWSILCVSALLEIEEGRTATIDIGPEFYYHGSRVVVDLPPSAYLGESNDHDIRSVRMVRHTKRYVLDISRDRFHFKLEIGGYITKMARKVAIRGSHGSRKVVDFKVVRRPYMPTSRSIFERMTPFQQSSIDSDGLCFGIVAEWLHIRVKSVDSLWEKDIEYFDALRTSSEALAIAQTLQAHQRSIPHLAADTETSESGTNGRYAHDHLDVLYTKLDGSASTSYDLATPAHLINWLTREESSSFAFLLTDNHAMGLSFNVNEHVNLADATQDTYSISFFDPNDGIVAMSGHQLEQVKDAVINYFEKNDGRDIVPTEYDWNANELPHTLFDKLVDRIGEFFLKIKTARYGTHPHYVPKRWLIDRAAAMVAWKVPANYDTIIMNMIMKELSTLGRWLCPS